MKHFLILLVGVALGLGFAWLLDRFPDYQAYRTTRDMTVWASNGEQFLLPAETPLLSPEPLIESVDFGWWGFAPIYFSTAQEAVDQGIEVSDDFQGPGHYSLSGSGDFGRPPTDAEPAQRSK